MTKLGGGRTRSELKKWLVLGLVCVLVAAMFTITVPMNVGAGKEESSSEDVSIFADTLFCEEELFNSTGINPLSTATEVDDLPEIVPYWVDMVDAEDKDVANEGEGVYIAVLDTGLMSGWQDYFPHANIADELGMGFSHDVTWDSEVGDFYWDDVRDDRGFITNTYGSGHGSHVTSTIVGYYFPYLNCIVRGVAPKVTIIPVLVLDTWFLDCPDPEYPGCHDGKVLFTGGTEPMIAEGINYIADLADELDGPVIISMSLGGSSPSEMIEEAIDNAIDEGVIVIASAGNNGYNGMGWPGAYSQVISCAAAGWTEIWYPDNFSGAATTRMSRRS